VDTQARTRWGSEEPITTVGPEPDAAALTGPVPPDLVEPRPMADDTTSEAPSDAAPAPQATSAAVQLLGWDQVATLGDLGVAIDGLPTPELPLVRRDRRPSSPLRRATAGRL